MQEYCLGFVCSLDGKHVLLIEKQRPSSQKGHFNGIGGKLEDGERPLAAMTRECREETGIDLMEGQWSPIGEFGDDLTHKVHVFFAQANLDMARSLTDEKVQSVNLDLVASLNLVPPADKVIVQVRDHLRFLSIAKTPLKPLGFSDLF